MIMPFSEKKMKQLLTNYFEEYNVTNLQKDSYEDFINNRIFDVIQEENKIEVNFTKTEKYTVIFRDPIIEKPHIIEEDRTIRTFYPAEARARDLTYDAPICINIEEIFSKLVDDQYVVSDHNIHNKVIITRIPIMLQSSRCNLHGLTKDQINYAGEDIWDYGGYFIIKGKERVLVSQERINYNINIFLKFVQCLKLLVILYWYRQKLKIMIKILLFHFHTLLKIFQLELFSKQWVL